MTIKQAKSFGKSELKSSPTPELDTDVILQHIVGLDRTRLLLSRDLALTDGQETQFLSSIEKRKTGFPVAYITGHKEFFGYDFFVTPDVLIPKPDTERLVELALDALEDKFRSAAEKCGQYSEFAASVCDMCAGSGCVGISMAKTLTGSRKLNMTFADISGNALAVAKENCARLLSYDYPVRFILSNLFENVHQTFDLIVTNPPYVPHSEARELLKDGRSEPLLALDGDVTEKGDPSGTDDGLFLIRRLVPQCYDHLSRNGILIMETGEYNAEATAVLFEQAGFRNVRIEFDMNNMMRDVTGLK